MLVQSVGTVDIERTGNTNVATEIRMRVSVLGRGRSRGGGLTKDGRTYTDEGRLVAIASTPRAGRDDIVRGGEGAERLWIGSA